jgi:hypothetical protein
LILYAAVSILVPMMENIFVIVGRQNKLECFLPQDFFSC